MTADDGSDHSLLRDADDVDRAIGEGRFLRWLALIAGAWSILSGLEVGYEHYRGSYSRRVMYTPVLLSVALTIAGIAGFFDAHAERTLVPAVMWAAGAVRSFKEARYDHLVGAATMGDAPASSVVDRFGRTHDVANLFVCDGSILPTQS